jgi:hypothetical protein
MPFAPDGLPRTCFLGFSWVCYLEDDSIGYTVIRLVFVTDQNSVSGFGLRIG